MTKDNAAPSAKDLARREKMLNAPIFAVITSVGTPLAVYQTLNVLFKVLDTMMASHISGNAVSSVAYISQIAMLLSGLGGGLAIGASVKISETYGAGDYTLVKKRVNSLFAICAIAAAAFLCLLIPSAEFVLRFLKTPEAFIREGLRYFTVGVIDLSVQFFNVSYMAVERSRGNSRKIFCLNIFAVVIKLSLTALFVYRLSLGVTSIAVATLISDVFIMTFGIVTLAKDKGAFGLSARFVSLRKAVIGPMLLLAFPLVFERLSFQAGKVIVNGMAVGYGDLTVGGLSVSNNINALSTSPQNGFQEAEAATVSQNRGNGSVRRAFDAFKATLVINICIGVLGSVLTLVFIDGITALFSQADADFAALTSSIYRYEAVTAAPLGVCAAITGLFYGFGKTKVTLVINFCRVFVFRVPLLWALQTFTDMGAEAAGVCMLGSNLAVAVVSCVAAVIFVRSVSRNTGTRFLLKKKGEKRSDKRWL